MKNLKFTFVSFVFCFGFFFHASSSGELVPGCTDETACNFNPAATEDDGSCEYFSCAVLGCTDLDACNFDATAEYEDGSCTYPDTGFNCDGSCVNDADEDGVCDADEVAGCEDSTACNYNAAATDDDGSCIYPDGICETCSGETDATGTVVDNDSDDDGVCDLDEITGCQDATACNYNSAATDAGDCVYTSDSCDACSGETDGTGTVISDTDSDGDGICNGDEVAGCTDEEALNFDGAATDADDSCTYPAPAPDEFAYTATAGSGLFISQVTLDGTAAASDDWIAAFDSEGNCAGAAQVLINGGSAYIQLVIYADDATSTDADEGMSGSEAFTLQLYDASESTFIDYYSATGQTELNGWVSTNGAPMPAYSDPSTVYAFQTAAYVPDCLDPDACNFDPESLTSNGCAYAESGYTCDGICLEDEDGDGVCDALEVEGCQDQNGCNYNAEATDSASCTYPDSGYDCAGECLVDSDNDGTCDAFEVNGCTDGAACNYNALATEADGTCTYPDFGLNCAGGCAADTDGDNVCDAFEIDGCDDSSACNYDSTATDNDGSCSYPALGYGCDGNCLADTDNDGVCDALEIAGCTDATACNYDVNATDDDGSCTVLDAVDECGGDCTSDADADGLCDDVDPCVGSYDTCGICNGPGAIYTCGCAGIPENDCDCEGNQLDALGECGGACVADADADGICDDVDACVGAFDTCGVCNGPGAVYECGCADIPTTDCDCEGNEEDALGICGGDCAADIDDDGVCDVDEVYGCTDSAACNYASAATEADNSCTYPQTNLDCQGECLNDADGDGVCDEQEISGCTGESAFNFQPDATDDDGSCLYPAPPPPSFEVTGTPASGTMFGQATLDGAAADGYDWIGAFDEDGNCAGASQLIINQGIAYINLTIYGDDATTADVDEGMTGDEDFYLVLWDESAETTIYFNANGSPSAIEGWTNTNGAPIPGLDDSDNVYEFSTDDYEPNCNDPQACNFDATSTVDVGCVYPDWAYDCDGNCLADTDGDGVCNPLEVNGCTNANACNYNSNATEENGTCSYASQGYGCDGECLQDSDNDGICDALEQPGCTDNAACNFTASATDDDGSCTYADGLYDCDGECFEDADADGTCDANEVLGCDDSAACNYDSAATEDDGSCIYPQANLDCSGNCLNDSDQNGVCDELEGCTDTVACNYSSEVLEDDGSCAYAEEGLDCDGACLSDADGDGVCDGDEVAGCTYPGTCNYDANATDDDGSCFFVPMGLDCALNCLYDADGDGVCDADELLGCTDANAENYNDLATENDGSCIYGFCPADLDGDGVVNIGDVLELLTEYGSICE